MADNSGGLEPILYQLEQHRITEPGEADGLVIGAVTTASPSAPLDMSNYSGFTDDSGEEYKLPGEEEDKTLRKFAPATKKRKRSTPSKPSEIRTRSHTNSNSTSNNSVTSPSSSTALPPAMPRKASTFKTPLSAAGPAVPVSRRDSNDRRSTSTIKTEIPIPGEDDPIPGDMLILLSAEDFDAWLAKLEASRTVTPDEDAMLKLVRRRIRNRESARDSRSNRKTKLQSLQNEVDELQSRNHHLHLQMSSLRSENQALREEANYLQDMINTTPALSTLFNTIISVAVVDQQIKSIQQDEFCPADQGPSAV